jgi:hypothetical protein
MNYFRMFFMLIALSLVCLLSSLSLRAENTNDPHWIFFTDKGIEKTAVRKALDESIATLNAHARWRRAKVLPNLVDEFDLPVAEHYLSAVSSCGAHLRFTSRWLNAVSVDADARTLEEIRNLPFVKRVQPVAKYWPCDRDFRYETCDANGQGDAASHLDELHYGPSFTQLELCHVPEMHARGLSGHGVRLCLLDTGFWLEHEVFNDAQIIATYDFINGDSIVWNEPNQDTISQQDHGTLTLSAAAGKKDSSLYGPAYGAELICGKTEDVRGETPIEEDFYVAGLEWADGLGADVVSTSLGYFDWYTYADMDGNTAVTTIAVDIAVSRGIVVCTAAGNEHLQPWHYIIAPADADSVIAVGAVDSTGLIASFSSPGPTADGRIKPEVCAQGLNTYAAIPWFGSNGYIRASGTSLSTPIIGGICALLLEAHPDWTPMQLREALLMTANQSTSPDTIYGWGIANGLAALDYYETVPHETVISTRKRVFVTAFPNPVNGVVTWNIEIPQSVSGSFAITDILGRAVIQLPSTLWTAEHHRIQLNMDDLPSGLYFGRFNERTGVSVGKLVLIK